MFQNNQIQEKNTAKRRKTDNEMNWSKVNTSATVNVDVKLKKIAPP
jgi:hypothetical protein